MPALLLACIIASRFILTSKFGMLLLAMRDKEERVRFSGYDVSNFKVFIFCVAAVISALGGAMFTLQVGFMSPSFVGIVPSIEMVIFTAVGGRMSLIGAVYGALLVNYGKSIFSETFPQLWLLLMGGMFIAVVMYFPNGLAGLYQQYGGRITRFWRSKKVRNDVEPTAEPEVVPMEKPAIAAMAEKKPRLKQCRIIWNRGISHEQYRPSPQHRRPDGILRRF